MKIITISKIGYNAPSQANWSYGIHKIDMIDTEKEYCFSYTVKENFGGDTRFIGKFRELTGYRIIQVKEVYPTQQITGIRQIKDIDNAEILADLIDFIK